VHGIPLEEAVELVRRPKGAEHAVAPLVWIDVQNPDEAAAAFLRERLGFHPLAVEDCIRGRQRPKLDRYPGYFFLVLYTTRVNPGRDRMALTELHVFLGERYIVSVHDHKVKEVGEVLARWRAAPARLDSVGALAHALMDAVVDNYIPVLNHFAERAERVENAVFNRTDEAGNMQQILTLRRELASLRRVVAPERDVLSTLLRRDQPAQSDGANDDGLVHHPDDHGVDRRHLRDELRDHARAPVEIWVRLGAGIDAVHQRGIGHLLSPSRVVVSRNADR
jgi:magnesium transporter